MTGSSGDASYSRLATFHALTPDDAAAAAAAREMSSSRKGSIRDERARPAFDALTSAVPGVEGVGVDRGELGGIPGWWCRPSEARPDRSILFLHGGGYALGSATAYRSFVGHFARGAAAATFIPDYRRAPEHPFPAAVEDAAAVVAALAEEASSIALVGDSAGGGLSLSLLSLLQATPSKVRPCCAAVMSPWTDLAMTGASLVTREEADPIFTRDGVTNLADLYLRGNDARDPRASPLYADMRGLPPIRIDVGNDEILLSDSISYAEAAESQGVDVSLHIWMGMPHVVPSKLGKFAAARASMDGIIDFLDRHLGSATL